MRARVRRSAVEADRHEQTVNYKISGVGTVAAVAALAATLASFPGAEGAERERLVHTVCACA